MDNKILKSNSKQQTETFTVDSNNLPFQKNDIPFTIT